MVKMAGNYTRWGLTGELVSWGLLALTVAIAATVPAACTNGDGDTGTPADNGGDVQQLLSDVAPNAILPALERFRQSVESLVGALEAWENAVSNGSGEAERSAAQQAYVATMIAWQEVEVHQLGPTLAIRDEIYSFPTTNPCRIDQETAEENWADATFFEDNNVNSYGLDGIEHLLYGGDANVCPSQVNPNKDGSWDALGADGVALNRAKFGIALAVRIQDHVDDIIAQWSDDTGFVSQLSNAGDGSPFESTTAALNAVYDGLFYIETDTKDRKLALPLGLRDCDGEDCAYEVEGVVSGQSLRYIEGNLRGFWSLFTNGEGYGMDQLLTDIGHDDLAVSMETAYDNAMSVVTTMDGPLDQLILDDREQVETLHAALREMTTLIKVDLSTVLTLEIPSEAAGDND